MVQRKGFINQVIGANAVVIHNVESSFVVVDVPARESELGKDNGLSVNEFMK